MTIEKYPSPPGGSIRVEKHRILSQKIDSLEDIIDKLEFLIARIQDVPSQPRAIDKILNDVSLLQLLEDGDGRIDKFIEEINTRIDTIEKLLF